MLTAWLLLAATLATHVHRIAGPPPQLLPGERRVVGGEVAEQGDFLYAVALMRKADREVICGGLVFDERHVLTAAHCIDDSDPASSLRVLAGVANKSDMLNPLRNEFDIVGEYRHHLYSSGEKNDISLLRVNGNFSIKVVVSRPPLAAPEDHVPYTACELAGWGSTIPQEAGGLSENVEDVFPEALNYVTFPLLASDTCQDIYWNIDLSPELLCAGSIEGGKDGCVGDSGSPLVCAGRLVGLMAAGAGCAQPLRPGVYLNISHYSSWIYKMLRRSYKEERMALRARHQQELQKRPRHRRRHGRHHHHHHRHQRQRKQSESSAKTTTEMSRRRSKALHPKAEGVRTAPRRRLTANARAAAFGQMSVLRVAPLPQQTEGTLAIPLHQHTVDTHAPPRDRQRERARSAPHHRQMSGVSAAPLDAQMARARSARLHSQMSNASVAPLDAQMARARSAPPHKQMAGASAAPLDSQMARARSAPLHRQMSRASAAPLDAQIARSARLHRQMSNASVAPLDAQMARARARSAPLHKQMSGTSAASLDVARSSAQSSRCQLSPQLTSAAPLQSPTPAFPPLSPRPFTNTSLHPHPRASTPSPSHMLQRPHVP